MNDDLVPEDSYGAVDSISELLQEVNHAWTSKVYVVSQHMVMQANACPFWANGYRATHRNATVGIENFVHRCCPARCKGAPDGRHHHKSRFIDKNQVSAPLLGLLLNPWKFLRLPPSDFTFISFGYLACRSDG